MMSKKHFPLVLFLLGTLFTLSTQNYPPIFKAFQDAFLKMPMNRARKNKIDTS